MIALDTTATAILSSTPHDARSPPQPPAPCDSNAQINPEIISKFRHGGPRANSGGSRPGTGGIRVGAGRPRTIGLPTREIWSGPRWAVYQTHPQAERLAAHELTRTGYRAYAPLIAVMQRDRVLPTMFHKVLVSRMPGYGFVELAPGDPWAPVQRSPGIRGLILGSTGKPALCGPGEVERHLSDDAVLCELKRETLPSLEPGAPVMIQAGAMAGLRAVVVADDGMVTMVSVEIFSRRVAIRMARAMLEAVTA